MHGLASEAPRLTPQAAGTKPRTSQSCPDSLDNLFPCPHVPLSTMEGPSQRTTAPEPSGLPSEAGDSLKEVKVKLPVDQVMRLHYTRMTKRQTFSEIVSTALTRYFDDLHKP